MNAHDPGSSGDEDAGRSANSFEAAVHVSAPDEPVAARHLARPYDAVLADGSVGPERTLDRIYLGAALDRLVPASAVRLLQLCRKALRPGGRLRLATEDLDGVLDRVASRQAWDQSGLPKDGFEWEASRFHVLNHAFRERAWFYNEAELRRLATMVGFRAGRRVRAADDPRFQIERLHSQPLVMEFERPIRKENARPTVDILIPVYHPDHFREALASALDQTWDEIMILVSDDGAGDASREIIDSFRYHRRYPRIQYFHNQPPSGGTDKNSIACLQRSSGDYIKFLFDDDVLEPRCVEKMASCLRDHPEVTLVTSHRRIINKQGQVLPDIEATRRLVVEDSRVGGAWIIDEMLRRQRNFVGEPSTAMFRRSDIGESLSGFWTLAGINFIGNSDVTAWLSLLAQGDAIYLTESLSRFRQHPQQTSSDPVMHEFCRAAWHRAARGTAYYGLYDPAAPPSCDSTPLVDAPWWTASVRASVEAARRELARGNPKVALAHAEQALATEPDDPRAGVLRAECLAGCGAVPPAMDALIEIVRRNQDAAGPYLNIAELAAAVGNRDGAKGVLDGAHGKLPLFRRMAGVVERDGATHLEPLARFEVIPGLPPLAITFHLTCRNASPTPERPIFVALMMNGVGISVGDLSGLGSTLALEAIIPARSAVTRLDLRWHGAVDFLPAPTDDPRAVRLDRVEIRLA